MNAILFQKKFDCGPSLEAHFFINKGGIDRIELLPTTEPGLTGIVRGAPHPHLEKQIADWLLAYTQKKPLDALPLNWPAFTPFTRQVLDYLLQIPFGHTYYYHQVASKIAHPKAFRAVGKACGSNPFLLVVPCHRVVATQGLGGFAAGLEIKQRLLAFEKGIHSG